jgi:hypothetical protein
MIILAHIGPVPVEELLSLVPALGGASLALRARFRRSRHRS